MVKRPSFRSYNKMIIVMAKLLKLVSNRLAGRHSGIPVLACRTFRVFIGFMYLLNYYTLCSLDINWTPTVSDKLQLSSVYRMSATPLVSNTQLFLFLFLCHACVHYTLAVFGYFVLLLFTIFYIFIISSVWTKIFSIGLLMKLK